MAKPRYPEQGCVAGPQARGLAWAGDPASNAWNVNLNNGNANIDNLNNQGLVLPVCGPVSLPGEYQGASLFQALYAAWERARKQKCSFGQLAFESRALDNLFALEREILAGTWSASPSACFIAQRPKAREIHAPAFRDRVVHHLVVPVLERIWEPIFIFDCYSNRAGKGTHAAADRLQHFMRQQQSGEGGGWFLQLDIRNFFNSIDRRRLYKVMRKVLERQGAPLLLRRIVHAFLRQSAAEQGVRHFSTARERALVPPHKRLENAAPGCGLAIGNLSSQFFANVVLNELDQFVKHELGAKRYLRYVDDFVLVHQDRQQLQSWQARIEAFLAERLGLELKPQKILKPLTAGCDFLGYIIFPTHRLARRRVIHHARKALQAWEHRHRRGNACRATPEAFRRVQSIWTSYQGHLSHASAWKARAGLLRQFPWLPAVMVRRSFHHQLEGRQVTVRFYPPSFRVRNEAGPEQGESS